MKRVSAGLAVAAALACAGGCASLLGIDEPDVVGGDSGGVDVTANDDSSGSSCDADLQIDPNNCGRCGRACREGTCEAGQCPLSYIGLPWFIDSIATAGGTVYYGMGYDDAAIYSVSSTAAQGGPAIVPNQRTPEPLVVQEPFLFWSTPDGGVWRAGADGSNPTLLWGGAQPTCIAANSSHAYWTDGSQNVLRIGLDAGPDSATLWQSGAQAMCVAASDAWVAYPTPNGLVEQNLATGTPLTVPVPTDVLTQSGGVLARPLAIGGSRVYFATWDKGHRFFVHAVSLGGGADSPLALVNGAVSHLGLVADAFGVYWVVDEAVGGLQGCGDPLCEGGVLSVQPCPYCAFIALDPNSAYYGGGSAVGITVFQR
jgi:hypothetical protein